MTGSASNSASLSDDRDLEAVGEETLEQVRDLQERIEAGDPAVVPLLIEKLRATPDRLMVRLLIRVIASLAQREHLRLLSKLYRHRDTHVRLWVLSAIARLDDHEYFPLMVHGFFYDHSRRVRSACRRTLRKLSPGQLDLLITSMEIHKAAWMREAAAEARKAFFGEDRALTIPKKAVTSSQELVVEALRGADLGPRETPEVEDQEDDDDEGEDEDGPTRAPGAAPGAPGGTEVQDLVVSGMDLRRDREQDPRERRLGIAEAIAQQDKEQRDRTFSRRDCPKCGERIMVEALLCRYCQQVFEPDELERVMELAKIKVVPLAVRSPSHRGSALVVDLVLAALAMPLAGAGLAYLLFKDCLGDGQSVGKRIYGLKTVDAESGEPCTPRQSLVRNAWLLIPLMPMIEVVRLSATGQRLGDQFGETRVIFDDDPPATALLASASLLLLSMGALVLVSLMAASQSAAVAGFR